MLGVDGEAGYQVEGESQTKPTPIGLCFMIEVISTAALPCTVWRTTLTSQFDYYDKR